MPVHLGQYDKLERRRALVLAEVMPDTCHIAPYVRSADPAGGWTEGYGPSLEFNGSPDIPCRLDPTRHYRKEDIYGQELIVNEYTMWLPYGVAVAPDMHITKDGERFEVRKLLNKQSNSVAQQVLLAVLE